MFGPATGNPRCAAYCAKQQGPEWHSTGKHLKASREMIKELNDGMSKKHRQRLVMGMAKQLGMAMLQVARTGHTIMTHQHGTYHRGAAS